MELGYLTVEGCLVVADSLGRRILFKGYRPRESEGYVEILGQRRPLEKVATARIQVSLHRQGWAAPGEVLLRDSPCRLYRTKTSHWAFGADWESLARRDWNLDPVVYSPWYSGGAAKGSPARPRPGSPFVVPFADVSVKGCRRNGATVELYAIELKEFTDFVLGKLRATLRFESEATAEAFARQFPAVADLAALDSAVKVEIDRSKKVRRPKRAPGTARKRRKLSKRNQRLVAIWSGLIALAAVSIAALGLGAEALVILPAMVAAAVVTPAIQARGRNRIERLDLAAKFPANVWNRFAAQAPAHAAGFAFLLRDRGIELRPDVVDLEPVDAFLRSLPKETCIGIAVLGAGALVGQAFLAALGRKVETQWVWQPKDRVMVLQVRNSYWISPLTWVFKTWTVKPKETLQEVFDLWAQKVRSSLAYGHRVAFFALGFTPDTRIPEALMARVASDAERVAPESFVIGDRHMHRRRIPYGPFSVDLVDGELVGRRGPEFIPLVALPFAADATPMPARLDGAAPRVSTSDDIAIVRLAALPLVPLGVQIRNFVEVGPGFGSPPGEVTLRLLAVSDKVDVVSPRVRETRPETKDYIVPLAPREDGLPTSSYSTFLGRIEAVAESVNPVTNVALWKLSVDVSGLRVVVLVRKDHCPALPAVGSFASGNLWLVADLTPGEGRAADYIR